MLKRLSLALTVFICSSFANSLFACSVCFGDPNSPMTHGAKLAVFFLLGVVALILGSFVAVAIFWMHRARLADIQSILHTDAESK